MPSLYGKRKFFRRGRTYRKRTYSKKPKGRSKSNLKNRIRKVEALVRVRKPELKYYNVTNTSSAQVVHNPPAANYGLWTWGQFVLYIAQGTDHQTRLGNSISGQMYFNATFEITPAAFDEYLNPFSEDRYVRFIAVQQKDFAQIPAYSGLWPYFDNNSDYIDAPRRGMDPDLKRDGVYAILFNKKIRYQTMRHLLTATETANGADVKNSHRTIMFSFKTKWTPIWDSSSASSIRNAVTIFCCPDKYAIASPATRAPSVQLIQLQHKWRDNS